MSNETLRWFDAGVNLCSAQFDADRQQVVQNARQAGVKRQLLISSDLAETALNLVFCLKEDDCLTTAGVHPHQAAAVAEHWQQQLQDLLADNNVVAVGECGLDFNRMFSPRDNQIFVFETQLALANSHQKAVYLHERDAFDTQLSLLKNHHISHGIAHCFTGNSSELKAYLDLGLYIGITGWVCDERRGELLQQAMQYLPLDRLILETDAPYLLPRNLESKPKSRRNEPAFVVAIANKLAQLTGWSLHEISEHSRRNANLLFRQEVA